MKPYNRPEKETDPAKYPGQIVNPIPNFEQPLEKAIEEYQQQEIDPRFPAAHYQDGRDLK